MTATRRRVIGVIAAAWLLAGCYGNEPDCVSRTTTAITGTMFTSTNCRDKD